MDEAISKQVTWQQIVDSYTDYLVEQAELTISDARMREIRRSIRLNQLSNLLSVTLATDSINAIVNWIYYQMGRRETQHAWKQTGLGDDVINRIKRMHTQAKEAGQRVHGDAANPKQIQEIHVAMVRLYVGYLRRWFIAKGGQS